ncbi:hypothetical protein ACFLQ1_02175, partial [Candidatus Auribacterota bacterium]
SNYIDIILEKMPLLGEGSENLFSNQVGKFLAPYVRPGNMLTPEIMSDQFTEAVAYLYFIANIVKAVESYQIRGENVKTIEDSEFYAKINGLFRDFMKRCAIGKQIAKKVISHKLGENLKLEQNSCTFDSNSVSFTIGKKKIYLEKVASLDDNNIGHVKNYIIKKIAFKEEAKQKKAA